MFLTSPELRVKDSRIGWIDYRECGDVIKMTSSSWKPEREVRLQFPKACQREMKSNTTQVLHSHWFVVDILQHIPIAQKLYKIV